MKSPHDHRSDCNKTLNITKNQRLSASKQRPLAVHMKHLIALQYLFCCGYMKPKQKREKKTVGFLLIELNGKIWNNKEEKPHRRISIGVRVCERLCVCVRSRALPYDRFSCILFICLFLFIYCCWLFFLTRLNNFTQTYEYTAHAANAHTDNAVHRVFYLYLMVLWVNISRAYPCSWCIRPTRACIGGIWYWFHLDVFAPN